MGRKTNTLAIHCVQNSFAVRKPNSLRALEIYQEGIGRSPPGLNNYGSLHITSLKYIIHLDVITPITLDLLLHNDYDIFTKQISQWRWHTCRLLGRNNASDKTDLQHIQCSIFQTTNLDPLLSCGLQKNKIDKVENITCSKNEYHFRKPLSGKHIHTEAYCAVM